MRRAFDVYVGDLTDVLSEHLRTAVNAKTQQFWAFRSFADRLAEAVEEYGITVEVESEAFTSQTCPLCGEVDDTERQTDLFRCSCGFEGHADLAASMSFPEMQADSEIAVRSMARPVRTAWDNHLRRSTTNALRRRNPAEERTNRCTRAQVGKLASVGAERRPLR